MLMFYQVPLYGSRTCITLRSKLSTEITKLYLNNFGSNSPIILHTHLRQNPASLRSLARKSSNESHVNQPLLTSKARNDDIILDLIH